MITNRLDGRKINLPDFFVAGAPRSGTTSLYQYMYFHPQIMLSSPKEPRFFILYGLSKEEMFFQSEAIIKNSVFDINRYSRLFKKGEGRICGDMTVTHMKHYDKFIKNVKKLYTGAKRPKIIIALRNPIEAAFSFYNYLYNNGTIKEKNFLDHMEKCKEEFDSDSPDRLWVSSFFHTYDYPKQLKAILSEFDDVYIYLLDDLKSDSEKVMRELYGFLGVDFIASKDLGEVYNKSGRGKKSWALSAEADVIKTVIAKIIPEATGRRLFRKIRHGSINEAIMTEEEKGFLKENFENVIIKTGEILGRDLSHWLDI